MNLYTAAVYTNQFVETQQGSHDKLSEAERTHFKDIPHVLESWHYVNRQRYVDDMRRTGAKVFLDSGAFSAWMQAKKKNQKLHLNVKKYCDYITENADIIRVEDGAVMASVLDCVGDPLGTYRNQLEMEAYGVRALPCFHFGEDDHYLEYYVANYSYITLGGMVGKTQGQLNQWLDRIFDKFICDKSGRPRLKVHGFGLTSIPMMENFPWYSCDSSSWIQYAVYGHLYHPRRGLITVSEKSPRRHDAWMHLETMPPVVTEAAKKLLTDAGFDVDRIKSIYEARAAFNMWSFREINKILNETHEYSYTKVKQELF